MNSREPTHQFISNRPPRRKGGIATYTQRRGCHPPEHAEVETVLLANPQPQDKTQPFPSYHYPASHLSWQLSILLGRRPRTQPRRDRDISSSMAPRVSNGPTVHSKEEPPSGSTPGTYLAIRACSASSSRKRKLCILSR